MLTKSWGEISYIQSSAGATSNAKGLVKFKDSNGTGIALENFLEGIAGSGSNIFVGDPVRDVSTQHYGFFLEDDYRVTPRITVNLGTHGRWFGWGSSGSVGTHRCCHDRGAVAAVVC